MSAPRIRQDAAYHSFDADIALRVDVNSAIVFRNIVFWVRHNEANDLNFHDGRHWTYNSLAAFERQFPYLTAKQIRTAIEKLLEAGLIVKGNFAQDKFKRANWYALGKCIENRSEPDSKPNPPPGHEEVAVDQTFDQVWQAYPVDRRRDRTTSLRRMQEALSEVSAGELLAAVEAYAAESADFTRSKVSFCDNWLRDGKWRRHVDDHRRRKADADAAAEKQLAQIAAWVTARHGMCKHLSDGQVRAAVQHGAITLDAARAAGFLQ
ncbi:MAG: hypothetical protein HC844_00960 [Tabrizicola sp.]|nr:hypothetical protein [Tabrizicola sp.]